MLVRMDGWTGPRCSPLGGCSSTAGWCGLCTVFNGLQLVRFQRWGDCREIGAKAPPHTSTSVVGWDGWIRCSEGLLQPSIGRRLLHRVGRWSRLWTWCCLWHWFYQQQVLPL
jgi:hypothetical protein